MASNSCTLDGGHDSLHEYQCSLCEEEGQHVDATKFCKECFVYMCDSCVHTKHNKFPLNKRHQMLEQTQFSTVKASSLRSHPTKRCPKHPGELINIYCGEHDVVCCIVCKTLEHSNCAKSQHLFDAAKGIHIKSKECQNIIQQTETFLSDVEKVISDGKSEMTRISEAKEEVKNKIADFRKRVDMYFDGLEAKCLDELQNLESKIISDIEQNVKYLDVTRTEMEDILQQLQSFKGDNECELFFHVKEGNRLLNGAKGSLLNVSRPVDKESIYYEVDPKIEEFLKSMKTLGSFTDKPVTFTHHTENTSEALTDKVQPLQFEMNATSSISLLMCALNGYILISANDSNNDKNELKRYSESYDYIDSVTIPGKAISLCESAEGKAAVLYEREMNLLSKVEETDNNNYYTEYEYVGSIKTKKIGSSFVQKVAFIAIGRKMILNKIFSTVENAYQIACIDGKVYVCCREGCFNPYEDKEKCHSKYTTFYSDYFLSNRYGEGCSVCRIAVYDDNGQLQHYVPHSPQLFPFHLEQITVASDARHFLGYNQSDKTVTVLDLRGNVVDAFGDINGYSQFCTDGRGHVFASGYNKVERLSTELQKSELLLGEKDGIKSPRAICFDKKHSRLFVMSCESISNGTDWRGSKKYRFTLHAFNLN